MSPHSALIPLLYPILITSISPSSCSIYCRPYTLNSHAILTSHCRYCLVPQLSRQCAEFAASLKELKQYQIALELLFRAKLYITSKQAEEGSASSSIPGVTAIGVLSAGAPSVASMPAGAGGVGGANHPPPTVGSMADDGKATDSDPAHHQRHERDTVKLQILFEMGSVSKHSISTGRSIYLIVDIYLRCKDRPTNYSMYMKNSWRYTLVTGIPIL